MTQEQKPFNLTFEFTLDEANAILAVLPELPGKVCNPLIEKIKEQAAPQIEEYQKSVAAETEASKNTVAE